MIYSKALSCKSELFSFKKDLYGDRQSAQANGIKFTNTLRFFREVQYQIRTGACNNIQNIVCYFAGPYLTNPNGYRTIGEPSTGSLK